MLILMIFDDGAARDDARLFIRLSRYEMIYAIFFAFAYHAAMSIRALMPMPLICRADRHAAI